MTKARSLWPIRRGGRKSGTDSAAAAVQKTAPEDGPGGRITPVTLAECVSACARFRAARPSAEGDPRRARLAESLDRLVSLAAAGKGTGTAGGRRKAGDAAAPLPDETFDALLDAAGRASERGGTDHLELALLLCDTALTERRNSRAAWRLRGKALDGLGDESAAVLAYDRYLELTSKDAFQVTPRVTGLKRAQRAQRDMLRLLDAEVPHAAEFSGAPSGTTWAEGVALHARGAYEEAEPRLVGALLALGAAGRPVSALQDRVGDYLDLRITAAQGDASGVRELAGLYAEQRRNRMRPPLTDPLLGGLSWLNLGGLRNLIAGRSVCLVANSERVAGSSLGPEIDAYDLVVRFSSYAIDAPATGTRTDIHATGHEFGFNWDRRVTVRMVFGGESEKWRYAVREKLVPGAQEHATDESVRWPLRNVGGVRWDRWPSVPTAGFNTLWLLDFLDVSPVIDLVGFDFYEGGVHRLPRAMGVPITSEREYTSEKNWVMERARSVTDMRISLR